ncbi:formylmethanofuran dehydrogenase [Piscinibacter sp. XHJ-5]|uniref:formylmethanofuran dehydrogenase n=1 Tax=Piscinibacter sp. XHJ-5 TaxID=3037797 RepID=UPI002452C5D9|nr:formylmethanofuran dehydrogenase [Piscinibacter sp. XHJ-5]
MEPIPSAPAAWTCPFCSLLCEDFSVDDVAAPRLRGSDCPRATASLAVHARPATAPQAWVDGAAASREQALDAAASRLALWQQPLFGGLGTDVEGARALCRLALRTGAICDHADGAALMHGLRATQDRGQYTTTLAEIRERADMIVCVGTQAIAHYPEFFRRCGLEQPDSPCRRLVFLAAALPAGLPQTARAQVVAGSGDLFGDVQQLAALVARQRPRDADVSLVDLAAQLRAARYAVLVWEAGVLPAQGALIVEALNRLVATLNLSTRAASFGLGGSDGAYSVNQTFTWLTGLPLRTRAGPAGLEHEPLRFDADRLLADASVDGLLWVSSFDPARLPPRVDLPRIVLGPPAMAERLRAQDALGDCVFVPVATPGLNAGGHLFRTDGGIVVPLHPVRDDGLPDAAGVLSRLDERLGARA